MSFKYILDYISLSDVTFGKYVLQFCGLFSHFLDIFHRAEVFNEVLLIIYFFSWIVPWILYLKSYVHTKVCTNVHSNIMHNSQKVGTT